MANEHIGRKQAIGFGLESPSGTEVAASKWLPKVTGSFTPESDVAMDDSAQGVIDEITEVQTTATKTIINLEGIIRDDYLGDLLHAALGTTFLTQKIDVSSTTGTFAVGELITGGTSSATGTIRHIEKTGANAFLLFTSVVSGTFGNAETVTGGTSTATGTTGTLEAPASVGAHVFKRLNDNTHPSYTFYGSDPVGDDRAAYCMLDNMDIDGVVGDFLKFNSVWMGKKLTSTSTQVPVYTEQVSFLPKFGTFKDANTVDLIFSATAVKIERFKLSIQKNLVGYQAFGDVDFSSFHNQHFAVTGEIDLLYDAETWRDYMLDSTERAIRMEFKNTDTPNIIGVAENPTFVLELPKAFLTEWSRSEDNNGLVKQTIGFRAVYDITQAATLVAYLINDTVTAYDA